ncbi:hypothetical protein HYPSUDRAFT_279122 [Hypholoma sublateritium FD-334 SS-4]|uniref:Uncharacterized protein n=1 Tax=Hypholoma sublateritium (strain FD-334 SS-4) TaxID=945553 RepID=A0A0D2LG43_HYPSF|nr:hypothetical protein HYPSUDRAFT_279122 [Hypholoma sublateritium FD-334 SS-4]
MRAFRQRPVYMTSPSSTIALSSLSLYPSTAPRLTGLPPFHSFPPFPQRDQPLPIHSTAIQRVSVAFATRVACVLVSLVPDLQHREQGCGGGCQRSDEGKRNRFN